MNTVANIVSFLESFAPLQLAEDWDNVGLLLGDRESTVERGMTCLTVTPEVVDEAIEQSVDIIVTHHPMPFRPVKKITGDSITGSMILKLIKHDIAVYSPHTAFDSTAQGINQMIADRLKLTGILPLKSIEGWESSNASTNIGVGRYGKLEKPISCREFGELLRESFQIQTVKFCGELDSICHQVGIACGSAGQFLSDASRLGCNVFITGETNFHTCLEAIAGKTALFLLGHYGSERFAVEMLADRLDSEFPQMSIHASQMDRDPIQYLRGR